MHFNIHFSQRKKFFLNIKPYAHTIFPSIHPTFFYCLYIHTSSYICTALEFILFIYKLEKDPGRLVHVCIYTTCLYVEYVYPGMYQFVHLCVCFVSVMYICCVNNLQVYFLSHKHICCEHNYKDTKICTYIETLYQKNKCKNVKFAFTIPK